MNTEYRLKSHSSFKAIFPSSTSNCLTIKESLIIKLNKNSYAKVLDDGSLSSETLTNETLHQNFVDKPQNYELIKQIMYNNRLDFDFFLISFANGIHVTCQDYKSFLDTVNRK